MILLYAVFFAPCYVQNPHEKPVLEKYADWVTKKCLPATVDEIKFLEDGKSTKSVHGVNFRVLKVKGELIWIVDEYKQQGWVPRKHLVLLDKALMYYTKKIREDSDPFWLYERAIAFELLGQTKHAIKDLTDAYEMFPDNFCYLTRRGKLFAEIGEYEKSLRDWSFVIEKIGEKQTDSASDAYAGRSQTYAQMKDYGKALTDVNYALQLDPLNVNALVTRGRIFGDQKQSDKALVDLSTAIRLDPTWAYTYQQRGIIYSKMKDYDKALTDVNKAILLDAEDYPSLFERSHIWVAKRQFDKAFDDAEQVYRHDPKSYEGSIWLAAILSTCPDKRYRNGERAIILAKKAHEIRPNDSLALRYLAMAYAEAGDFESAIGWERKLLADPAFEKKYGEELRCMLKYFESRKRPWHEDEKLP